MAGWTSAGTATSVRATVSHLTVGSVSPRSEHLMSSMDRWRQHDRTVISLGYDAARRERAAANAPAYVAALRDGSAWAVFSQALRDLGPALAASWFSENETDLAEGYRYLLGLVTMRLNSILYPAGPQVPAFVRAIDHIL